MQRRRKWPWIALVILMGTALTFFGFVQPRRESNSQPEFFAQNVITVERGDILLTLELTGELRPEREAFLRFPITGTIAEILVKERESVQAGQALARLEDAEQQLELLRAQQGPRQTLDSPSKFPLFPGVSLTTSWGRELGIQLGTRALGIDWTLELTGSAQGAQWQLKADWVWTPTRPRSELERLEHELALRRAQAALDETELRAPFAGVVGEVRLHKGERVTEEDSVLTLLDLSSWWVEASVAERDLALLAPGQQATVSFEAYTDLVLPAELIDVRFSRPTEQTKQLRARLRLLQEDSRLMPALTARMIVILREAKNVLRVPLEAVVEMDGKHLVTRVREGQLEEVEVHPGLSDDRWMEIRSGLAEGDQILANNYQLHEKYRGRP